MTIGIRLIVPTDGRRFYLGTNLSYQPLEMVKSNRTKQTKRNQTTQTQPGATGGVYKGQGRNQHELMTRAY